MIEGILFVVMIGLVSYLAWSSITGGIAKCELQELKEGIIEVIKQLKPKKSVIIHYGNQKQLTFIKGGLQ